MIVLKLFVRGAMAAASVLSFVDKHLGRLDRWNEERKAGLSFKDVQHQQEQIRKGARKWPS